MVIAVLITVAACSRSGAPVENGPRELTNQLLEIRDGGEEKLLRDLVPGDWTAVHIFEMESITGDYVDEEVGFDVTIPADDYFVSDGAVFVFINNEEVVWAAAIYGIGFGQAHAVGDEESVVGHMADRSYLELK